MIGPGEKVAGMECCKQRTRNGKRSQECGRNEFLMRAEAEETRGGVAERFRIQKAPETGSKDHISKPKKHTAGRRLHVHLVHLPILQMGKLRLLSLVSKLACCM